MLKVDSTQLSAYLCYTTLKLAPTSTSADMHNGSFLCIAQQLLDGSTYDHLVNFTIFKSCVLEHL